MITQRLIYSADGSVDLVIHGDKVSQAEIIGLAEELNLRSTVTTEGPIHQLNDPQGNGGTPNNPAP